MTLTITILGSGPSMGVPTAAGYWGACDPAEPKNQRMRSSILVTSPTADGDFHLLLDMTPDLRTQCLIHEVRHIDAVICTHAHHDHAGGLPDLKAFSQPRRHSLPLYSTSETLDELKATYRFAFEGEYCSVEARSLQVGETVTLSAHLPPVHVIGQRHGTWGELTIGVRMGTFAYTTDVTEFHPETTHFLRGLDLWIIGCLQHAPHPTHVHLPQALEWIKEYQPRQAVLTHMAHDMDYATLIQSLPSGVLPAWDGMKLVLETTT